MTGKEIKMADRRPTLQEDHQRRLDDMALLIESLPAEVRAFAEKWRPAIQLWGRSHTSRYSTGIYNEFLLDLKRLTERGVDTTT